MSEDSKRSEGSVGNGVRRPVFEVWVVLSKSGGKDVGRG